MTLCSMFKITAELVSKGFPDKCIPIPYLQASDCSLGNVKVHPSCHLGATICFYRHSQFSGLDGAEAFGYKVNSDE